MGFKIKSLPETVYRSLTDFSFYRELARRPLGEAFIYLLILLLIPTLLIPGYLVYQTHRLLSEINRELKGNLPPLRVDRGEVFMDGEESFHFEKENDFPVERWRNIIGIFTSQPDWDTRRQIRRRDAGEELTEEEKELIAAFEAERERGREAQAWIDRQFPEPGEVITSATADRKLAETPPEDEEAAELLIKYARYFNYAFRVDLTDQEPDLPPGMMGYALGPRSYKIFVPPLPEENSFSENDSMVINHSTLNRWRNSHIQDLMVKLAGGMLIFAYLISLLISLGGTAVAGLTASLSKCSLPFGRLFSVAIYALTPPVIFALLAQIFLLLGISIPHPFLITLAIYGYYTVSAARSCCARV